MEKIAIIGGGPSGLVAAIFAKKKTNEVTIFEKNSSPLKKLLITGNGKCNFWNEDQARHHYHSTNEEFLNRWLTKEKETAVLEYFQKLGIVFKIKNGYYYPNSNQAISIKNALIEEAESKQVQWKNQTEVKEIKKVQDGFQIKTNEETLFFTKVVIATGSYAYPNTGSTGDGYAFASTFHHQIIPVLPSLTSISLQKKIDAEKVRCDARVQIFEEEKMIKEETGELQITKDGVSGICVFNLSRYASLGLKEKKKMYVKINFLPFIQGDSKTWWISHCEALKEKKVSQILDGILNYQLGNAILNQSHIAKDALWKEISKAEKDQLYHNLTEWTSLIITTSDFTKAQVALGGVSLNEVTENLESKRINGLYFAGEVLDVDGDSGGYNLGFAWMSGMTVGKALANLDK